MVRVDALRIYDAEPDRPAEYPELICLALMPMPRCPLAGVDNEQVQVPVFGREQIAVRFAPSVLVDDHPSPAAE